MSLSWQRELQLILQELPCWVYRPPTWIRMLTEDRLLLHFLEESFLLLGIHLQ